MLDIIKKWTARYFANEETVVLMFFFAIFMLTLFYLSNVVVPLFISIALAYLLQGGVVRLQRIKVPRFLAVLIVELFFITVIFVIALILLPSLWSQLKNFVNELPKMLAYLQTTSDRLIAGYPEWVSPDHVEQWNQLIQEKLTDIAQKVLSFSFAGISNLFTLVVYLFLIPMLVFFFLKDRDKIVAWISSFLPNERPFIKRLSSEMNVQISNYVRGKIIEILVVGIACFIMLKLLGVRYSILLSVLTGLSVLVPYFGAAGVGLLVAAISFFQFGTSVQFIYVMTGYGILQMLDGNILVPVLFSEAVNLHPVAILIAVLTFGGIWGFWGLFFAIPLATLVNAMINSWPRKYSTSKTQHPD